MNHHPAIDESKLGRYSMPMTEAAREFVRSMQPQVAVIRGMREELHDVRGRSAEVVSELLLQKVGQLADAFEELADAVTVALGTRTSS
jgi:hypothetical protein